MEHHNQKGQWGSRFGFLMAAVGSAVGLGNLWKFPYVMGKGGGFAFLFIYLIMVALVGVVILLSELALGRKTGKGVIAAYRGISQKYTFIGWMSWISPVLILGFYSMLGGYCIKYTIANVGDFFGTSWGVNGADSAAFFKGFYTDPVQTVAFTVLFVFLTILITRVGVSKGIEKFSAIAMPALFVMLCVVIVRSVTLPGASEGLAFVFKPNFDVFKGTGWISVLASASGQMFFSLSLGMAIMVTYGSYMKKNEDLQENAIIIPIADTLIAVMAGVAIMPAVFASGQDPAAGPGLLFITLQTVFSAMGSLGPVFGTIFYGLVFIAAITSSISLVEAVSSAIMDRAIEKNKPVNRTKISLAVGIFVALEGALVALDGLGESKLPHPLGLGSLLDFFDLISEGILMPVAALLTAVIFGWIKPGWLDSEIENKGTDSEKKFKMRRYFQFCLKWIVPPVMILVLAGQMDSFFGLNWFN